MRIVGIGINQRIVNVTEFLRNLFVCVQEYIEVGARNSLTFVYLECCNLYNIIFQHIKSRCLCIKEHELFSHVCLIEAGYV